MKKMALIFPAIFALLVAAPFNSYASEVAEDTIQVNEKFFNKTFESMTQPVMLKYIAEENNCYVVVDNVNMTASVANKGGAVIKTYNNPVFVSGEPVVDAGIAERDMGWTVCRHIPNTDIFMNENDAVIAGGLTFFAMHGLSDGGAYYIGRCWDGFYFSPEPGEHVKGCSHGIMQNLFYEKRVVVVSSASEDETILLNEEPAISASSELAHDAEENSAEFNSPVINPIFESDANPVILKYILRKKGYRLSYDANDDKSTIYDAEGNLVTSLKNVPVLYGNFVLDAVTIQRALGEDCSHEPDSDLFDSELDAVTAGWLKYYKQSQNEPFTFYVGNCYDGCYFSELPGRHAASHNHPLNVSMFYEIPVVIVDGALEYGGTTLSEAAERDAKSAEFAEYEQKSRKVVEDRPENALTKMVTVIHTEYAGASGVQAAYFSYRDRVYRNYWEDLAGYDVTDYIFIPPNLPLLKNDEYANFNEDEALKLSEAVKSLLEFKKDARIWIGTTGITSLNYNSGEITSDVLNDFLEKTKKRLGTDIWSENVVGLYINQEAIYPETSRNQVYRVSEIVNRFKNKNPEKKALWIPYYDLAADSSSIAEKIGEVSRIAGLFDYVIIQPGYFFFDKTDGAPDPATTSHRKKNIDAISHSVKNNYVSNQHGEPVSGKSSNALIGLEMEPQASYFSSSRDTRDESIDRYTRYLLAGATIKEIGPIAFYTSGDPGCNKEVLVNKFYGADELSAKAVRKKLDDNLDKFYTYVFETREKDKIFTEYAKGLYLAADVQNTEEGFQKAFNAAVIIPEFYEYEKIRGIEDLASFITNGGVLNEYLDNKILRLLGYTKTLP